MSLLLLFAGTRAAAVVTPPVTVDQTGGPTARSIHQVREWRERWDDEDFAAALTALLLL